MVAAPPRVPSGEFAQRDRIETAERLAHVEARTQGSPWRGVDMPLHLREGTPHEVLRWYVQHEEANPPQPRGVIDAVE